MTYHVILPVIIAFAVSALLGPVVIPFLRRLKVGQTEQSQKRRNIPFFTTWKRLGRCGFAANRKAFKSRILSDRFCDYFEQFGLLSKTNIDLPGEASTIMHKRENIGQVELATMSFGQSFQITPIQLATTVSSIIN